jgi:hypothetical protein
MKPMLATLAACALFATVSRAHALDSPLSQTSASSPPEPSRAALAAYETTAFGVGRGHFINQLVGARLELYFSRRFFFELGAAYANLEGKDRRVHNLLPELSLRYRAPLHGSLGLPLRFAGGYLPKNGPTMRVSAGLDFEASRAVRLELNLIEPMLWVTRDRSELSVNLGAGVSFSF